MQTLTDERRKEINSDLPSDEEIVEYFKSEEGRTAGMMVGTAVTRMLLAASWGLVKLGVLFGFGYGVASQLWP